MAKDLLRMVENQRPTEEELEELFIGLTSKVKPKARPKAQLKALVETVEDAKKLIHHGDELIGLSTGFNNVDKLTKGINASEIIVVFGDTGHGKSQLCQNIALNVARQGKPVLFVGLEMNNEENTARFLNMGGTEDLPILYPASNDIGYQDIDGLVKAASQEGVALVVIDHLHMFARNVDNLANELSLICHEFKRVARAYKVPVMVVSHINRSGDKGGPPHLKDLKGSSSIEQDADIALAVWNEDMVYDGGKNLLTIALRKNRKGRKQTIAQLNILDNAKLQEGLALKT